MPGMNGHEVASGIRLVRPSLAIILHSGSEVPTKALALVDAFVPKVDPSQQLLPVIAYLCSRKLGSKPQGKSMAGVSKWIRRIVQYVSSVITVLPYTEPADMRFNGRAAIARPEITWAWFRHVQPWRGRSLPGQPGCGSCRSGC